MRDVQKLEAPIVREQSALGVEAPRSAKLLLLLCSAVSHLIEKFVQIEFELERERESAIYKEQTRHLPGVRTQTDAKSDASRRSGSITSSAK